MIIAKTIQHGHIFCGVHRSGASFGFQHQPFSLRPRAKFISRITLLLWRMGGLELPQYARLQYRSPCSME